MNDEPCKTSIGFDDLDLLGDAAIESRIGSASKQLIFDIKMHSIDVTNDPNDIAEDFIDAAFFAESLAKHCSSIDAVPIDLKHGMLMRFMMTAADIPCLIAELRRIQPWFDSENYEPDDALRDEVGEFFDNFLEAKLRVPQLGDSYMANFLGGSRYYENRREFHKKHPTWRWGFWRSFAADQLKCDFYTSSINESAWIIVGNRTTVERLLKEYGGFTESGAHLYDATSLHLNGYPHLLVTPQAVMQVPSSKLGKAVACWNRSISPDLARGYNVLFDFPSKESPPSRRTAADVETDSAAFRERFSRFEQKRMGSWEYRFGFKWAMTESGDALMCGDDNVSFVTFSTSADRLRAEAIRDVVITAEHAVDLLRDHAGLIQPLSLDWSQLSPEQFEDFCYDVLLRSGRFDEKTIRKHGKTRSRDGGRDIEAWTLPQFGLPGTKWIFQCKLITRGKSLAGTMVTVADVVDQYAASGFGVMTNEVIDSTLYDKMDAIAKNRALQLDSWDGRRLQRFISVRRDLLQHYFRREEKLPP